MTQVEEVRTVADGTLAIVEDEVRVSPQFQPARRIELAGRYRLEDFEHAGQHGDTAAGILSNQVEHAVDEAGLPDRRHLQHDARLVLEHAGHR